MKSMPSEKAPMQPVAIDRAMRKPYAAPRLHHLGSVRDLVLGATGTMVDAQGFRVRSSM